MNADRSLFQKALPVSMAGVRAATARVEDVLAATEVTDNTLLPRVVIETLWWQKSIEDLWEEELGEAFYRKRDGSAGGLTVGGLAYARNSGGHRVGRTYDEVVYRAASTVESVVLASFESRVAGAGDPGPTWPALSELPPLPMDDPFGRPKMYADHVGGRPLLDPLHAALEFFEGLLDE